MAARVYGELALKEGGGFVLDRVPPHVSLRLKSIFPRIPKHQGPPYTFDATPNTAADLAWFLDRFPATISPATRKALDAGRRRYEGLADEMEAILAQDYVPPAYAGLREGRAIRPYQTAAVEVLFRSMGLLLGDDVGLGKTYTTAGACVREGGIPAVIVVQPHLRGQWCEVIRKMTHLRVTEIKVTKPHKLPPTDVFVMSYTQLAGWCDFLVAMAPALLAFDEVQELRGGTKTAKGYAAKRIAMAATHVLGLSATPIYNYGVEMWEIMNFIRPDVLGEKDDFIREWCSGGGKIKDPQALGTFLREQHAFLRRLKRDVNQHTPPVNKIVETIDYDPAALKSVDAMARMLATKAVSGTFVQRGQASRDLDMLIRHQTGVGKAKTVAQFVRMIVESGEPVLVAGWHRDVYEIWAKQLKDLKPVLYTGSETPAQKQRAKDAFMAGAANGGTDLMFISLRSGAGLDGLQERCSTVVAGELDWSPGVHHQLIGRLDREGQTNYPVNAFFLVTEDGSDPPMMDVLGLKASEAHGIIDPSLGVQTANTDESHLRKLVSRYLNKRESAGISR